LQFSPEFRVSAAVPSSVSSIERFRTMLRVRRTLCLAAFVLPFLLGGGAGAQVTGGWLVYGNDLPRTSATATSLSAPSVRPAWFTPISGRVSAQALVAEDTGRRTVYVATSKGVVYAIGESGYIRWRTELGQLERICGQIDGYGVTGTPAIDRGTSALYLVDAFGRLHALDLATGEERPGWPVTLYPDFRRELVWGALTIVKGSIYLGTGSYCDRAMEGKVFRIEIATRAVSQWNTVPKRLGGGGSVWGWGGIAYSATRDALFLATGNAFRGGANVGKRFRESAGFGERLVEVGLDLSVRASNHPSEIRAPLDLDFVGSPVLFPHRCGELVAILNKDGFLYVWRSARIARGRLFSVRLAKPTLAAPLITQIAYSPLTRALYATTPSRLVRVDIDARCRGRVAWSKPVGGGLLNGSPTVAGSTLWLAENDVDGSALLGFDARTGRGRFRAKLAGPAVVAPTVVGRRLYLPTYTGGVQGFALASALTGPVGPQGSDLPEHRSFYDKSHGWVSREDGVYATDDGEQSWRRIYPRAAVRVARTSARSGIIVVGDRASKCGCRTVRLWTSDGGARWHPTREALGSGFVASGGALFWWRGDRLYRASSWPPRAGKLNGRHVAHLSGVIVDADPVPGGVVALVSRRTSGAGLDSSPRLILVQGKRVSVLRPPGVLGEVLASSVEADWPALTVRGLDVTAFTREEGSKVTWRSVDGGRTWSIERA
jgi:putative pyrroloquinoline-quinone binding quinoprotein